MEIVPDVHIIENVSAHSYIIDTPEMVLIDTGLPGNTKKILKYITDTLHKTPTKLKSIILTHCDIDHIGNANELRKITGAKIFAHPLDAVIIAGKQKRPTQQKSMGFLIKFAGLFLQVIPFSVDTMINHDEIISGLTVLHMPGHTPGSIALYDHTRKVLFIGDTLRYKHEIVLGPPPAMTWDLQQTYQSIEKLMPLNFKVLLSGHSEPLTNDASKKVHEFIEKVKQNKTYQRT
jgi:glyoxylase-like metal-dependent hydrolase (beta-lactamase superfamily II)